MQPSSVEGVALLSERVHALTRDSRTCVVRVTDGTREGHLRFEHGEVVEVCFGQLYGASAMVALMSASGLRHEFVEPREASAEPEQTAQTEARQEPEQNPPAERPRDAARADSADASADALASALRSNNEAASPSDANADGQPPNTETSSRSSDPDAAVSADTQASEEKIADIRAGARLLQVLLRAEASDAEHAPTVDTADHDLDARDSSASAKSNSGAADAPAAEVVPAPPWEETDASAALSPRPFWQLEAEVAAALARAEVPPWEAETEPELALAPPSPSQRGEEPRTIAGAEPHAPALEALGSAREQDQEAAASEAAADSNPEGSSPTVGDRAEMAVGQADQPAPSAASSHESGVDEPDDAPPQAREPEAPSQAHTLHESQEADVARGPLPAESASDGAAVRGVGPRGSDWPHASSPAVPRRLQASLAIGALAILAALLLWKPAQQRQSEAQRAVEASGSRREQHRESATNTPAAASAPTLADTRLPAWREGPAPVAPPHSTLVPTVQLRVLVGEDGKVRKTEVVSSRPSLAQFEERAIEAARLHRFAPATRGGTPVQAWTTLWLAFEPSPGPAAKVIIKGSEAIGSALGTAWTEAFEKSHPGVQLRIDTLGTKTGFAGLLDGTADLAAASHVIGDDELALAAKLGVALREIALGQDGVAVIVHPENPVRELDLASLAQVFTQQVTRWDELSGASAPIQLLVRPSYSGTRHSFEERVLSAGTLQEPAVAPLPARMETGRETVERVARDPHAIGYVSLGLLQPTVRAVALKAGAGAVAVMPSEASIRDGSYPLVQPLLLYARTDASYAARAFAEFAVSRAGQDLLPRHQLVALPSPGPRFSPGEPSAASFTPPDLLRIYFKSKTAHIATAPWPEFWAQAARLGAGRRALVIGHTDSTGDGEVNHRLAQLRAGLVANLLRRMGGADAPIEQQVARSEYPLASNETPEGQRSNRRVDVYVLPR